MMTRLQPTGVGLPALASTITIVRSVVWLAPREAAATPTSHPDRELPTGHVSSIVSGEPLLGRGAGSGSNMRNPAADFAIVCDGNRARASDSDFRALLCTASSNRIGAALAAALILALARRAALAQVKSYAFVPIHLDNTVTIIDTSGAHGDRERRPHGERAILGDRVTGRAAGLRRQHERQLGDRHRRGDPGRDRTRQSRGKRTVGRRVHEGRPDGVRLEPDR